MKDQFVPYELVLQMKELGFDEKCIGIYAYSSFELKELEFSNSSFRSKDGSFITAPLWQQAFDWFESKYNMTSYILPLLNTISFRIQPIEEKVGETPEPSRCWNQRTFSKTEARIECLKKLIELCKKN